MKEKRSTVVQQLKDRVRTAKAVLPDDWLARLAAERPDLDKLEVGFRLYRVLHLQASDLELTTALEAVATAERGAA